MSIAKTLIVAGVLVVLAVIVLATSIAGMGFKGEGEPTPYGDSGIKSGAGGCSLNDTAFTDIGTIKSVDDVFSKIGNKYSALNNAKNKDNLQKIITGSINGIDSDGKHIEGGVNPAILISFYYGEQTFKQENDYKAFGCGHYSRGASDAGFDNQLACALPIIKKAIEKDPVYDTPAGENAWTRLLFHYVAAARKASYEKYGYVSDSSEARIQLLNNLVPDQVTCDAAAGKNTLTSLDQAEMYFGTTPEQIKKHLETVSFMGQNITINKMMADDLKNVETQLKKNSYKITSIGAYNNRENVNSPGDLSSHAFGLAIDINPSTNPNANRPANSAERDPDACKHDIPDSVAKTFEDNNFFWGAKYKDICDPMHFQYGGNWQ